jgi:uncharacterized protein YciI
LSDIPQVDFPVDQFELLILREGERFTSMDPATVKRLQAEHVAYLFQLQRAGKLLAAGAVAPRSPQQHINGLGFFRLGSVDTVRELIARDPSVIAGLDSAEVLQFISPKGHVRFGSVV